MAIDIQYIAQSPSLASVRGLIRWGWNENDMTNGRLSFPHSGECECNWGSEADWGEHQSCCLCKSRGWEETYGHTEIYQLSLLQWGKSGLFKSCALIVRCIDTTVWYFMTLFPPLHLQNFMFEFQETQAVLFDKVIEISVSRRVYKCVCKTRRVGVAHLNYVIWGHLNIFLCVSQIIVFAYSDSVLFFVLWTSRLSTKRP